MPTLPAQPPEQAPRTPAPAPPAAGAGPRVAPHTARRMAESFGEDAARYDAARPGYPDALVARIVAAMPAPDDDPARPDVLDVGCGTGIAARQFQAAGCTVLGVEPDPRMADFARSRGLDVEGRDVRGVGARRPHLQRGRRRPVLALGGPRRRRGPRRPRPAPRRPARRLRARLRAAARSGRALRRRLPPRRPDSPLSTQPARRPLDAYQALYATFGDAVRDTGAFDAPEHWRYDWQRPYTRDEWLALLPTTGGLTRLTSSQLSVILSAVGTAIDALGGAFTMPFTTLATTAALRS